MAPRAHLNRHYQPLNQNRRLRSSSTRNHDPRRKQIDSDRLLAFRLASLTEEQLTHYDQSIRQQNQNKASIPDVSVALRAALNINESIALPVPTESDQASASKKQKEQLDQLKQTAGYKNRKSPIIKQVRFQDPAHKDTLKRLTSNSMTNGKSRGQTIEFYESKKKPLEPTQVSQIVNKEESLRSAKESDVNNAGVAKQSENISPNLGIELAPIAKTQTQITVSPKGDGLCLFRCYFAAVTQDNIWLNIDKSHILRNLDKDGFKQKIVTGIDSGISRFNSIGDPRPSLDSMIDFNNLSAERIYTQCIANGTANYYSPEGLASALRQGDSSPTISNAQMNRILDQKGMTDEQIAQALQCNELSDADKDQLSTLADCMSSEIRNQFKISELEQQTDIKFVLNDSHYELVVPANYFKPTVHTVEYLVDVNVPSGDFSVCKTSQFDANYGSSNGCAIISTAPSDQLRLNNNGEYTIENLADEKKRLANLIDEKLTDITNKGRKNETLEVIEQSIRDLHYRITDAMPRQLNDADITKRAELTTKKQQIKQQLNVNTKYLVGTNNDFKTKLINLFNGVYDTIIKTIDKRDSSRIRAIKNSQQAKLEKINKNTISIDDLMGHVTEVLSIYQDSQFDEFIGQLNEYQNCLDDLRQDDEVAKEQLRNTFKYTDHPDLQDRGLNSEQINYELIALARLCEGTSVRVLREVNKTIMEEMLGPNDNQHIVTVFHDDHGDAGGHFSRCIEKEQSSPAA